MYMIQRYLDEIIYGGMDGVLTTVSIIAGVYGSNINVIYGFILGVANLLADGFSMGISRYLSLVDINKSNVTRKNAIYRGIVTFLSFCILGLIPILSLFICLPKTNNCNEITADGNMFIIATLFSFIFIGYLKSTNTKTYLYTIIETLLIGLTGVSISYFVSVHLKNYFIQKF